MLCRTALSPDSELDKDMTEKGVLQLLFDLRFLHNILSAGKPASVYTKEDGATTGANAEVAASKEAFEELETQLQVAASIHGESLQ